MGIRRRVRAYRAKRKARRTCTQAHIGSVSKKCSGMGKRERKSCMKNAMKKVCG